MAIDLWVTGDGKIFSCSNRWLQHWSRPVQPCRPCQGSTHYEFLVRITVLSSHLRNLRNLGTSLPPITYPEVPTDPQRILTALFKQTIKFLRRIKLPYTHVWTALRPVVNLSRVWSYSWTFGYRFALTRFPACSLACSLLGELKILLKHPPFRPDSFVGSPPHNRQVSE